jgi:hypothetical protein
MKMLTTKSLFLNCFNKLNGNASGKDKNIRTNRSHLISWDFFFEKPGENKFGIGRFPLLTEITYMANFKKSFAFHRIGFWI